MPFQHVLAIDTASPTPSVALYDFDSGGAVIVLNQIMVPPERCAELLLSAIQELLVERPEAIVVATGAVGGWTGLRIGLTVAKTMAWAWNVPVVGIQGDDPDWVEQARVKLRAGEFDDPFLLKPFYHKEPNIICKT